MGKTSVAAMVLFHEKDENEKESIVKHLTVLKRHGKIDLWEKGLILAGENPKKLIQKELEKAEIVLFLVSIESIDSDEIWKEGVERSLERHRKGELVFIPVIVRACQWEETEVLKEFKPLPESGKPIAHWPHPDEACKQIADVVKKHVERISRQKQEDHKQLGIIPPEFKEIEIIFQKMPDDKVMKHMLFADHEGKPASAAHFAIYAEMLRTIRKKMNEREEYNFYFDNLDDAKKVQEIGGSIRERAALLKIDTLSIRAIAQELEDASQNFRLDFGTPENAAPGKWHLGKVKYVMPFCDVIWKIEKKLDTLSQFSVPIDLSDLSPN